VELGLEGLFVLLEVRGDGPVFLGLEPADLVFPLADQAERHGLDPAGG
jgi:hypothetical protein